MLLTIILASGTALGFGVSDFVGGRASRSERPIRIAAFSHGAGLITMVVAALLWTGGGGLNAMDVWWGAIAGVTGAIGIFSLYAGLSLGRMGVVTPITASLSASLPVIYGFVTGERIEPLGLGGLGMVFAAILLVSVSSDGSEPDSADDGPAVALTLLPRAERPTAAIPTGRISRAALGFSLLAGVCFSSSFILLSNTSAASGLWPVVALRVVSVLVLSGGALIMTRRVVPDRSVVGPTLFAGVIEALATVTMLLSVQRGPVAVAAVVGSLYPAITALLAGALLHERLVRHQVVGLALALAGIAMLSV